MIQNYRRLSLPAVLAFFAVASMAAAFGAVSLPQKYTPTVGSNLTMSVTGAPTGAKFQWKKSNDSLTNATSANYTLGNVTYSNAGPYSCLVTVTGNATFGNTTVTTFVVPQYDKSLVLGWGNNTWGQTTPPSGLSNITAIAAGTNHSLAVRANGTVVAWGDNSSNQTAVPAGLTGVSTVAAAGDHSLALRTSGTVVAWGSNSSGESDVPTELTGVVQIAAGTAHSLALKSDGTVVAWGDNSFGQSTVPAEAINVTEIAAAGNFCLARKTDGTIVAWGDNADGQLDIVNTGQSFLVAAGPSFSLSSLLSDGTVDGAGANGSGQLDIPVDLGVYPTAIACGDAHVLAVDNATKLIVAWGENAQDQATVPAGLGEVKAVAAGGNHSLALKSDGTVVAWGDNTYGQSTVPGGFPDAVAISAGGAHTLALKKDGTVVAWGDNSFGQAMVPDSLTDVVAVSGGSQHSLALKKDGTVVAWGGNSNRQTDVPLGLTNVIAIAAGGQHSLALKAGGTVVAWGDNSSKQSTVPDDLTDKLVIGIAAGASHSLAIWSDGKTPATTKVIAWGSNTYGQCTVPADLVNVSAVAGGYYHSLALKTDKTVVGWGSDAVGQITAPAGLANVGSIAAGGEFSMALTGNGTLKAWGSNASGQTDVPAKAGGSVMISAGAAFALALQRDTSSDQPPKISTQPISQVVANGTACTFTIMATGDAPLRYQWRKNGVKVGAVGNLVSGVPATWTTPVLTLSDGGSVYDVVVTNNAGTVTSLPATITVKNAPSASIASGNSTLSLVGQPLGLTANATGDGTIAYQWKRNGIAIPGANTATYGTASLAYVQGGYYSVDVTDATGLTTMRGTFVLPGFPRSQLVAWGTNSSNQTKTPSGLSTAIAISSGTSHSLALLGNGTAVGWGLNTSNQTVVPANATGLVAVSAGGAHSLALTMNGTVRAWGASSSNQTTVPAAALTGVMAIAAGGSHSLALLGNGTVLAWGSNTSNQTTVPTSLSSVSAIAAGGTHSMALTSNGSVVCWGNNSYGQSTVPAGAQSGVTAIAAGNNFSLALKANGTVVAWGSNSGGETSVPSGLAGVIAITAGGSHAIALKSDGSVVSWGSGSGGVPSTLANVAALAAGGDFSVALRNAEADTLPVIATQPVNQTIADGTSTTFTVTLASGSTPISYQWWRGASPIPAGEGTVTSNATTSTYTTPMLNQAYDGSVYRVVVSNDVGNVTSSNATLTVKLPPTVPLASSTFALVRQPLTISSNATGIGNLTYQWSKNGVAIPGATTANYTVSGNLTFANGGFYSVNVTDSSTTLTTTKGTFVLPKFAGTQIFGWGSSTANETIIPSTGMNDVVQISAGGAFVLALRGNGTVGAWGLNTSGQTTVPSGLANVVAVAAGEAHSLALKADGTVSAWGSYSSNQTVVPSDLASVIAIAAGANHSLALTSSGKVVAWGNNDSGQATVPEGALSGVTAIAAGANFSLALKSDNSVVAWGYNGDGQTTVPVSLGNQTVSALSGGVNFSLALTSNATANGTVTGWGSNSLNQTTSVPPGLSGVTGISAGSYHTLAVNGDGKVFAWGWNQSGQTNVPADMGFAGAVSASRTFSLALCEAVVPTITSQPADALSANGTTATFTVVAAGTAPLTYSWSKNGTLIASTNNASYTTPALTLANSGSLYSVTVSNPVGSVVSRNATLTVKNPPTASLASPQIFAAVGQPLTIASTAGGEPPFTYQWRRNGIDIPGATTANFTTSGNLTFAEGGYYSVTVVDATTLKTKTGTFVLPMYALSQIRNWGSNTGNVTVPSSLKTQMVAESAVFVGMAAGKEFALALTSNATVKGRVVAWGSNSSNQTVVPAAALSGMVAVSAGDAHSLALIGNGTVLAWGNNTSGQSTVPASAKSNVVSISAGAFHSVALLGNGTAVAWGSNATRQCAVPAGLSGVVGISAGGGHTLAVTANGTVVAWGDNTFGQVTVPASALTGVVAVSAGSLHSLALKSDGTVVAWGSNSSGQTTVPDGLTDVTAIAAGGAQSLALKSDGTVVGWGYNAYGQATPPTGLNKVGAIAAGYNFSLALRDAAGDVAPTIKTQPASKTGGTGQTATFSVEASGGEPLAYQWRKNGAAITQGGTSAIYTTPTLALTDNGTLYSVVVTNDFGNATSTNATLTVQNPPVVTVTANAVTTNATVGSNLLFTATANATGGNLTYQWKINGLPQAGQTGTTFTVTGLQAYAGGFYSVDVSDNNLTSSSGNFVLPQFPRSQVRAWGSDSAGQANVPAGLTAALVVASGTAHTLAIVGNNGTVTGWGSNEYGQITIPAGLTGVVAVAGGSAHSLALTRNGTVVAWGWNGNGQTTIPFGLAEVTSIAAGANHSLAVRKSGYVSAWGDNSAGQSTVPPTLEGVASVAAGASHSLALKSDGTVVAWGSDVSGQTNVPAGLTGVVAIAAGDNHSLALLANGAVVAWGANASGQSTVPDGLTGVVAIAAGASHSLALKSDGTVVAWGLNTSGQTSVPADLGQVGGIAAGGNTSLVLRNASNDVAPTITVQPVSVLAVVGKTATFTVTATGSPTLRYQWRKNGVPIAASGTSATYTTAVFDLADGNSVYDVVASNNIGSATSANATLTVVKFSAALSTPSLVGQPLTLTAATKGTATLAYQWKHNGMAIPGATSSAYTIPSLTSYQGGYYSVDVTDANSVNTNGTYVLPQYAKSQVRAWGSSSVGQTGVPLDVTNTVLVSAGFEHSLALSSDGTVKAWGSNQFGQTTVPTLPTKSVMVAAGGYHSLALSEYGWVTAWGSNGSGQTNIPANLESVVEIAAGANHSLALKLDGAVVGWGNNDFGQTNIPAGLAGVIAISAGANHSLALLGNGTVVAWGDNSSGQATVPDKLANVVAIAAGGKHSLALLDDGTVVAWGDNSAGQASVPDGLSSIVDIAAGDLHSIALRSYGTVAAWGSNASGQCDVPAGMTSVGVVSAGGAFSLALRNAASDITDTKPVITPPAPQSALLNIPYSYQVVAAPAASLYGASGLPAGLSINATTGLISGTPTTPGTSTFTLSAQNSYGISVPVNVRMAVGSLLPLTAGNYLGLVGANPVINNELGGSMKFSISSSGAFTGQLVLGTSSYQLKGSFSSSGNATVPIPKTPLTADLTLALDNSNGGVITGSIGDGTNSAVVVSEQIVWNAKTRPATAYVGMFNMLFKPDAGSVASPQGYGFATAKVDAGGAVRISGRLSDNTALSYSGSLWGDGVIPMSVLLYSKKGSFLGGLAIDSTVATRPLTSVNISTGADGTVRWVKLASGKGNLYPAGFTANLTASGSEYLPPPKGTRVIGLVGTSPNAYATANFSSGNATDTAVPLTVSTSNTVQMSASTAPLTRFSINASTGAFTGAFNTQNPKRTVNFQGLLIGPTSNIGRGFFLMPGAASSDPVLSREIKFAEPGK